MIILVLLRCFPPNFSGHVSSTVLLYFKFYFFTKMWHNFLRFSFPIAALQKEYDQNSPSLFFLFTHVLSQLFQFFLHIRPLTGQSCGVQLQFLQVPIATKRHAHTCNQVSRINHTNDLLCRLDSTAFIDICSIHLLRQQIPVPMTKSILQSISYWIRVPLSKASTKSIICRQ